MFAPPGPEDVTCLPPQLPLPGAFAPGRPSARKRARGWLAWALGNNNLKLARVPPCIYKIVRTRMKIRELIFALVQKSAERVRNVLEMQGLVFSLAAKSAEVAENK